MIDDARARQRRQRRIGGILFAAVLAGALFASGIGGGGGGAGAHGGARPSSPNPGGGTGHASASSGFPGAPLTQPNGYGVESDMCPLARPNRYLPPRSGCVSARLADVNGDGRPDLVIAYSSLSHHRPSTYPGEPPRVKRDFDAQAAFLKVVLSDGTSVTIRVHGTKTTRATGIDAVAHVGSEPGDEVFLEVERVSSGATLVAYGFHNGRLVPAGVFLGWGGDSGAAAGFDCGGHPPRLIQRSYLFVGPNEFTRSWRETDVVYAWHGLKLVRVGSHRLKRLVKLRNGDTRIGSGCIHGVS